MDGMVREFALQMLRKLQIQPIQAPSKPDVDVEMDGEEGGSNTAHSENPEEQAKTNLAQNSHEEGQDENMEDGQLPPEALVHTPYLPEQIELPAKKSHVLQHVELLFALSVKVPEFLDE